MLKNSGVEGDKGQGCGSAQQAAGGQRQRRRRSEQRSHATRLLRAPTLLKALAPLLGLAGATPRVLGGRLPRPARRCGWKMATLLH